MVVSGEAGFVDAWIDFNADRDWNDAGEQIAAAGRGLRGHQHPALDVGDSAPADHQHLRPFSHQPDRGLPLEACARTARWRTTG
ncbi:MAG: hypothetical protein U1G05_14630 [Kiritimatiellia bacterium]